jgi:hypothetical protein
MNWDNFVEYLQKVYKICSGDVKLWIGLVALLELPSPKSHTVDVIGSLERV